MRVVIITGSAGLIGAETVRFFAGKGFKVIGIDNNMRKYFFGEEASTEWSRKNLEETVPQYSHIGADIRDAEQINNIFSEIGKQVDVVITTCGTLDHDLARIWEDYYHGDFMVDDKELFKKGINRLGNIFIPNECYGKILEEKMQPILEEIYKKNKKWSTKELIWEFGKHLEKEKNKEESIIYWAWKKMLL